MGRADPAPAACRLSGMERAAASAEETDIDAVELPLPGADILDFSRGVTDLDAVGKEVGATPSPGSLPSTLRGWHDPSPTTLPASRGLRGQEGLCSIPQLPDQSHLPLQGCPLAGAQGRAMCSHTERVWGRADRDFFSTKTAKIEDSFGTVEIPMGSVSLFENFLQKYAGCC